MSCHPRKLLAGICFLDSRLKLAGMTEKFRTQVITISQTAIKNKRIIILEKHPEPQTNPEIECRLEIDSPIVSQALPSSHQYHLLFRSEEHTSELQSQS